MAKKTGPRRGRVGRVVDVRFVEVEFVAPRGTRIVIELEGDLRMVLANEKAIPLAAAFLDYLAEKREAEGRPEVIGLGAGALKIFVAPEA